MATIPVEKKAATPWWLWLLGLLLLALLLWFFVFRDTDEVTAVDTTEQPVAAATTGLDLSDVWVTRVVGDNTFFVAPDSAGTDETLVYLEEEPTPGTATEGRYDVTAGQHVSLVGTMVPFAGEDLSAWGLTPEQAEMAKMKPEYVRISALNQLGVMADGMMDDTAAMADTAMAAMTPDALPAAPTTGTITTTDALYGTDLKPIIGRRVEVDNATVLSVVGDSTFYVGSGGKRFLVALSNLGESQTGPGDGSDGRFNINTGDKISLRGTVRAFDTSSSVFRGLSAADRTDATTRGAFVNVTRAADVTKK